MRKSRPIVSPPVSRHPAEGSKGSLATPANFSHSPPCVKSSVYHHRPERETVLHVSFLFSDLAHFLSFLTISLYLYVFLSSSIVHPSTTLCKRALERQGETERAGRRGWETISNHSSPKREVGRGNTTCTTRSYLLEQARLGPAAESSKVSQRATLYQSSQPTRAWEW